MDSDYGHDLFLTTFDENGFAEEGLVYLQLKATDSIERFEMHGKDTISFPIDRRDLRRWSRESMPVYFVLYDAHNRVAYWLYIQAWFATLPTAKIATGTNRVHIPKKNRVTRSTIKRMGLRKNQVLRQVEGMVEHHE